MTSQLGTGKSLTFFYSVHSGAWHLRVSFNLKLFCVKLYKLFLFLLYIRKLNVLIDNMHFNICICGREEFLYTEFKNSFYPSFLYYEPSSSETVVNGHKQLISNGGRFKTAFVEKEKKQTMIDL